ncbi:hypothetical protein LJR168_001766 [Pseudoxanthomonas sp. LjRoot168]|uniref:hypothetical protein n=1 Tax=unclassified Pseudoxanthomonas TaxID=2645906 RepID=UPI003ECECC54
MSDKRITKFGVGISIAYIAIMTAYTMHELDDVLGMKPNEFGDFLAGAFGPLALAWVVVGYFQQGVELRQNTQALELQVKELQRSVAEQARMNELALSQHEFQVSKASREAMEAEAQYAALFSVNLFNPFQAKAPATSQFKILNSGSNVVVTKIVSNDTRDDLPVIQGWGAGVDFLFTPSRAGKIDGQNVEIDVFYTQRNGVKKKLEIRQVVGDAICEEPNLLVSDP